MYHLIWFDLLFNEKEDTLLNKNRNRVIKWNIVGTLYRI